MKEITQQQVTPYLHALEEIRLEATELLGPLLHNVVSDCRADHSEESFWKQQCVSRQVWFLRKSKKCGIPGGWDTQEQVAPLNLWKIFMQFVIKEMWWNTMTTPPK